MQNDIKQHLKQEAERLGFHDIRCTSTTALPEAAQHLNAFLAEGHHGDMDWMAKHESRRRDVRVLWPEARTAILVAMSYTPETDPLAALNETSRATISVYAQGKDYHDVVKPKLKQLASFVQKMAGGEVKVFVDTAPLMEKPWAERAGLGWQGKHTNLVARRGGSWFFIGAILATADIASDTPETDHCGACRRCLDICPTNAFPAPYKLDARRCISYLTIEHKGHIDLEFRRPMGNRIYGCDDCLAVCPWNKFAIKAREARFEPRCETANPPLKDLLTMDDTEFRRRFAGTAIKRTGRDRMMRNILIAAGNAKDPDLLPQVERHLRDPAPIIRAMAVWALSQIAGHDVLRARYASLAEKEEDVAVGAEWQQALNNSTSHENGAATQE